MHHFEGPNGTRFYTAAMPANIDIGTGGHTHAVDIEDLLSFADHVRRERGGAMVPEHYQEIEKREFVRRAVQWLYPYCAVYEGAKFIRHDADKGVRLATELWDALQKAGL